MSDLIDLLSKQQLVWRGRERSSHERSNSSHDPSNSSHKLSNKSDRHKGSELPYVASGYPALDEYLGGLPKSGVMSINAQPGIGELRLLLPTLRALQGEQNKRLCVFINPPGKVSSAFLYHQGVNIEQVLIVTAKEKREALWAAESCAKSGACSMILLWHNFFEAHQIKRLQLACDQGECLQVLLRSAHQHALSLPIALSVQLSAHQEGVVMKVTKRKGGWPIPDFNVDMSEQWPSLSLSKGEAFVDTRSQSNILPFPSAKRR